MCIVTQKDRCNKIDEMTNILVYVLLYCSGYLKDIIFLTYTKCTRKKQAFKILNYVNRCELYFTLTLIEIKIII